QLSQGFDVGREARKAAHEPVLGAADFVPKGCLIPHNLELTLGRLELTLGRPELGALLLYQIDRSLEIAAKHVYLKLQRFLAFMTLGRPELGALLLYQVDRSLEVAAKHVYL